MHQGCVLCCAGVTLITLIAVLVLLLCYEVTTCIDSTSTDVLCRSVIRVIGYWT